MSADAEKEASEVLHSLLSIERVQVKNQSESTTQSIENIEDNISNEDSGEDKQNEIIDIETTEDDVEKPPRIRYKKSKIGLNHDNCDSSEEEDDTPESVAAHLQKGCECTGFCYEDLDAEEIYKHRLNIAELTKSEHDMYLMGVTMASMANSKTTSRQKERQRQRATYVYKGKKVCLEAFLFLENVTLYQIKMIRNHVLCHGVTPRKHGNLGKKPHNTFSLDMYKNVEHYVKKYLKSHTGDFNKTQVVYGITRTDVYNSYKDHGRKPDEKLMGYSTFRHFMKKQFPHIKFQKANHSVKHGNNTQAENTTPKKRMKSVPINRNLNSSRIPIKIISNLSFEADNANSELIIKDEPYQADTLKQTTYILTPISVNKSTIKADTETTLYVEALQ